MKKRLKLDDEAVLALVADQLDADAMEAEAYLRWDTHPDIPLSDIRGWREEEALNRARAGDWRPIADQVRRLLPEEYGNLVAARLLGKAGDWRPIADQVRRLLPEEAGNLVAARLLGKIKKKGPAKKPIDKRRLASPAIGADDEYELIWPILRERFPGERIGAIKARAREIAAERAGIEVKTLENYRKSKRRVR
jgi:uncharacterized protein YbaR (Trm112 family)